MKVGKWYIIPYLLDYHLRTNELWETVYEELFVKQLSIPA